MAVAWMEAAGPLLTGASAEQLVQLNWATVVLSLHATLEGGPPALAVKPEMEHLFCTVMGLADSPQVCLTGVLGP